MSCLFEIYGVVPKLKPFTRNINIVQPVQTMDAMSSNCIVCAYYHCCEMWNVQVWIIESNLQFSPGSRCQGNSQSIVSSGNYFFQSENNLPCGWLVCHNFCSPSNMGKKPVLVIVTNTDRVHKIVIRV
uniref:Uncharacterized protein n=1 Tax=Opuntia streptacantha TaxID=393608 RepID=A0A7C8YWJ7_OPUST